MLNTSQKAFPVNAAISKQKVLRGLKQVTQAWGLLIPVKWEQSTNSSFLSQTWGGLYFPASALGVPDGMCQYLGVFFSLRPGKHEGLGLQLVAFLFRDSSRQPCTRRHGETSTFVSRNVAQGTTQKNLCSQLSLESKQQKDFGRKWGQTSSRVSKICGVTQEPHGFLALLSRDGFQKGQSKPFPPVFHGVNDQPGFWEWQKNSSAAEVFQFGAEADLGYRVFWEMVCTSQRVFNMRVIPTCQWALLFLQIFFDSVY